MGNCLVTRKGGIDYTNLKAENIYYKGSQTGSIASCSVVAEKDGIMVILDANTSGGLGTATITGCETNLFTQKTSYVGLYEFTVKKGSTITISSVSIAGYGSRNVYLLAEE